MLAAWDTETYTKKNGKYTPVLDCTKFSIGCLITENKRTPEFFYKKEDLWQRIIELGEKEAKRGKTLNLYGHHCAYDFYAVANLKEEGLKFFSNRPFIVSLKKGNKEIIKFLDKMEIDKRNKSIYVICTRKCPIQCEFKNIHELDKGGNISTAPQIKKTSLPACHNKNNPKWQ